MASITTSDRLSDLFADAFRLARTRLPLFAVIVALSTLAGTAADLIPDAGGVWAATLFGLFNLYLQLLLTSSALGFEPTRTAVRQYPSAFGLALISGIGILLGLLLLVLPGLFLLLRWSISLPILIDEDRGVTESLRRSWDLTRSRWWLIFGAQLFGILAWVPLGALLWLTLYPTDAAPGVVVATNFYMSLLIPFHWLVIVALYRRLRGDDRDEVLPAIFS